MSLFLRLFTISAIAGFVFVYPRFLIGWLGPANPWTSFGYQYGFGLITFLIGIVVVLRGGACKLGRGSDTLWFVIVVCSFFVLLFGHAFWIWAAYHYPYLGPTPGAL